MPPRILNAERYDNGRIKVSQAVDRGNPRISSMRQLFDAKCFQKGGRGKEAYDGIGQLWLTHRLEGFPIESNRLMDVGREYARLYHQRYSVLGAGIGKYEPSERTTHAVARRTRDDVKFERMDASLARGSDERRAIYDLVCKYHNTDTICDWAARIIADGLLRRGFVFDIMELSGQADHAMLAYAIRGLFWLHDEELPATFERNQAAA
jgi:hypothetical protein